MDAITLKNVSKRYRIFYEKNAIIKSILAWSMRKKIYEDIWALKGVSFNVKKGETIGIIGKNGSGKSTLLKVLAGVTRQESGKIQTEGRASALLELGIGFHGELTGRENIYINGSILGLTKKEIDRRFERIARFAEIDKFIEAPIQTYSTGMYLRLGFAVAIHVDFDILLIDEVLAVGDIEFQKKCREKMEEFKEQGKTILLVSHNLELIRQMCEKVICMDKGIVRKIGSPEEVTSFYENQNKTTEDIEREEKKIKIDKEDRNRAKEAGEACREGVVKLIGHDVEGGLNELERALILEPGLEVVKRLVDLGYERREAEAKSKEIEKEAGEGCREGVVKLIGHDIEGGLKELERALILEPGSEVIKRLVDIGYEQKEAEEFQRRGARFGSKEVEISGVNFIDSEGIEKEIFQTGEPLTIRISYVAKRKIEWPVFGIALYTEDGIQISGPNTKFSGQMKEWIEGSGEVHYAIKTLPLLKGKYSVTVAIHDFTIRYPYDFQSKCYAFRVGGSDVKEKYGIVALEGYWSYP